MSAHRPRFLRFGPSRHPLFEARFEHVENEAHYRTIRGRARNEQAARELFERRQQEQFGDDVYPLASVSRLKG